MRTRSLVQPGKRFGQIDCYPVAGLRSFYSSSSTQPWNLNEGPNYFQKEKIVDELTPAHVHPRPYHYCSHEKQVAAVFDFQKLATFNQPGPPNLPIRVSCPIMADRMGWPTTPISFIGGLVDELASLAEGTTSNSAMLPVTLLEGAKTLAMMRNPFGLLKPNFRRKVRKLTARVLANASANVWLEGYYGWKSFYQDTETIAKATAQFLNDDHQRYLEKLGERLSVHQSTTRSEKALYSLGTSETTWNTYVNRNGSPKHFLSLTPLRRCVDVEHSMSITIGCRQFLDVRQRMSQTRKFLSAYGLIPSWRTVRDTIWEVIPFSFVIDWFVDSRGIWAPLNKFRLGQMDIKNLGYSTTRSSSYHVEMLPPMQPFYQAGGPWYGQIPSDWELFSVERSLTKGRNCVYDRRLGLPPDFSEEVSFNTKGLSFIRSINGLALITQLLAKKA